MQVFHRNFVVFKPETIVRESTRSYTHALFPPRNANLSIPSVEFVKFVRAFFCTSNFSPLVCLRLSFSFIDEHPLPFCGRAIKSDCGQFRPGGTNALLHVKHLCSADIGIALRRLDARYFFLRCPREKEKAIKDDNDRRTDDSRKKKRTDGTKKRKREMENRNLPGRMYVRRGVRSY